MRKKFKKKRPKRLRMNELKINSRIVFGALIFLLFFISIIFFNNNNILGKIKTSNIKIGESSDFSSSDNTTITTIKLYNLYTETVDEIDIEDYVKGVVIGEMPMSFDVEALKAQAVCARTYAYYYKMGYATSTYAKKHNADICSSHLYAQEWLPKDKYSEKIGTGDQAKEYLDKLNEAVESTKGEIITYNDKPIIAYFHSSSSGQTENASSVFNVDVPYLVSVSSPEDDDTAENTFTYSEFIKKVDKSFDTNLNINNIESNVKVLDRTVSGRIDKIQLGNKTVTGVQLRTALGLKSTNISINVSAGTVTIETKGYGHGVGLSQYGANYMAKNGSTYENIIKHYYTGVEIKQINEIN